MGDLSVVLVVTLFVFITTNKANTICQGEDGVYPVTDVFKYLQCRHGTGQIKSCEDPLIFHPESGCCVEASSVLADGFCSGRPDGNYKNPWDCTNYISCSGQNARYHPCPEQTVYDPESSTCIWKGYKDALI